MEEKNIKLRLTEKGDCHYIELNESQFNLLQWLYSRKFLRSDVDYEFMNNIEYTTI